MLCADAFSRLPLEEINSWEDNIDLVTHDISFLNVTPLDHLIIEEETNKDPVLNKLKEYLLEDPQLAKKDETMKPFLSKLENFSVLQGCIFVDSRAVIPSTCQDQMLKLLHQSHIGINRMKSLARSSVWWPKMDSQIEEFVKECSPCMHHQTAPPAENTPWPRTNQPWQRVHVDHFYFRGDCYLLVVDANSNWIEVFPVRGTTSQENIKLLRECFARYGLPQCLVSDNGPPFNSIEFKEFLRKNNVYHLTSPAYNPSSNGIAEVSVRIIKKSLEKSLEESPNSNMDCILQNVLFNYRNTPTSLDKPPVERLLSYVPRTFVNCLNSEFIQKTFGRNECGRRHFQVGDKVMFTRVIQNRRKWFKAQVIRRLGYNVYLVKNLKGTFKVHVNQMRTGSDTKYAEDSDWTLDNAGAGPHRLEQDPQISTTPPPRRSTRPRRPPCRVTELRRSRRLQGREPILQPLPQLIEMEDDHRPTVSGSYLPCQRQRDPSTFSGDGNINPGQWLKEYERVSKYNRWDETMKLANVVFYLNGTAGRWFDNNEESLNSWRSFEDAFRGVFGLQEDSARRAEEVLKSRAQKAEESSESYIQEILSLCHQVNPRMEEGERVAHIIKGISEDTYQVLVAKDIQTVDEILKFCRHLTTVKQRRIGRTKFARLSNVMPISCVDDSDDLAALIRRIVREEIQKIFSAPEVINPLREVNALEQTVREEVSRALQPTRPQVNVVQQQPRTPYYNIDRPTQPRKTEHWRTHDDKPICFHCGRPGHVVRYCRERRQVFAEARSRNGGEGRNVGFSSRPPRYDADDDYVTPQTSTYFYRSSSPHPSRARSPARRQSQSPARRFSHKFRRELKTPLFKEPGPILKAANKNLIETLGKCVLNIEVNGLNISFEFVVMVECSHDIIFGWDFFKATEAVIDCGRNELHLGETSVLESREEENQRLFASDDFVIPPKSIKKISVINEEICGVRDVLVSTSKDLLLRKEVLIPNSLVTFRHGRGSIWVANGASWPQLIPSGMNMCTMESYENGNICNLIESSDKLQETQLKSREWSQMINLTLDPGLSEIQRLQLVSCLDEFIGIFDFGSTPIKPTSTVKHKINTGDQSPIKQRPYRVAPSERRLIQDEVNKMIENHIVKPSESPWSSPVILIEVDEKDREKTAFITPDGLYEFQVMPFGLCNAPATFERMIDSVLGSLKWNMCLCYLDDIVVYAPTFEEHLRRLQLVLSCIQKAGLSLNHKKCLFGSRRIKILGHLVDANGIHPDPDKVEAVSKFPRPRNISELKSFLGLCSYYRRFIENFAGKARSLHDLLKTEKQFYWDAAQEKAFEVLKTALISEPVLGHFDESADTHLHTDASGHGIGAVLLQIQGGKERPIAYASRSLTKAENNYSTTEKECLAVVWSISKFRPYLFGRPFTVVTDHHSLCWLVGQKDPSGRLARWALKLQEFDVTVIYKSGRKHKDADCLSRSPLENDQPSAVMSLTNVDIEQTKDPDLAKIIDNLNSGYTRKEFSIIDGILYKKNYSTTGRPWLMMIPKHLRSEVMADLHDAPTAGHLGFARTYDKVKKRFYWPGLYRTVRQYVSHCRECQRRKKLPRRPAGQLVSIPPVEKPFYKIGVDLLGRFPVSKDGNRWIIVCTDYMTRYAITKAIPDGGAIETAKFLVEDVILKHGAPREMITDRGRNFISQVIKEINALCGIVHRFTTAYHPQTNGLTERFNKTLGDMLSMYTGVEQKDWDQVLPYVTFAYNTAKQEATGYTPFFLVHAREAETYIDAVLPYLPDEISNDYVGELVTRAEEARQLSRSRLLQSQAKDRRLYDQKHTPVYYQKDDLVWVFTPIRKVGLSEKLLKRYFGPYKVFISAVQAVPQRPNEKREEVHENVEQLAVPILGLDECVNLNLVKRVETISEISVTLTGLLDEYKDVFKGNGHLSYMYDIKISDKAVPKISPARRLPRALLQPVKEELFKMEEDGIIEKIEEPTVWAHPMVVVKKPSGKYRICIDPRELNKWVLREHYTLPAPENILAKIPKAKSYSVLDAKSAFWQVPLSENTSKYLVMSTPFGRYRFLRLPFGISSAPEIFQKIMHKIFCDIPNVVCYIDDLLIWGNSIEDHNSTLEKVLDLARESRLKLTLNKLQMATGVVKFLGHTISQEGILPDQDKDIIWNWNIAADQELNFIKTLLTSPPVLRHFDPNEPLEHFADASKDGLGAILMQKEKLFSYASASLTSPQKHYSQIEKELLALYFGCKRFHYFLYGRKFTAYTDHTPLVSLLKENFDQMSPRLQRLSLYLLNYQFELKFIPGKSMIPADTLSRHFLPQEQMEDKELDLCTQTFVLNVEIKDQRLTRLQEYTLNYKECCLLKQYILTGWPLHKRNLPSNLKPHWEFKEELHEWQNLICRGNKLLIPKTQRSDILKILHASHQGINNTIALAKRSIYWPGMNKEIEELINNCSICQQTSRANLKEPMLPHQAPDYPWQKVGIDIFQIESLKYLLIVDYFSKYPEIYQLQDMTTDTIIRRLKKTFSNFGIPETLFVPSMINNEAIQKQLVDNQVKMKNYYDRHTRPADPLSIKDNVWFQKDKRWIPGQITNQAHEPRSFYVKDQEGNEYRRNSIHIREDKRNETTHTDWEKPLELSQEQVNLQDLEESTSQHSTQPTSSGQLSSPGSPKNVTTTGPPENWTNGSPKNLITTRSGR
ncbi:hypothetical protein LAZ67_1006322, partial [Cordylochernes scorpioides]